MPNSPALPELCMPAEGEDGIGMQGRCNFFWGGWHGGSVRQGGRLDGGKALGELGI